MALFGQTRMVYWKFELNGGDITSLLLEVIKSIKIRDSILPSGEPKEITKGKNKGTIKAPSEATISVSSKDYVENIFLPGSEIKIYMGYDKLVNPLVFSGKIRMFPDGSASEMLHYTVKAYGDAIVMALKERNYVPSKLTKKDIILEIALRNKLTPTVEISDSSFIPIQFVPIQRKQTDLDFITQCAYNWNCVFWVKTSALGGIDLFFMDSKKAHAYGDTESKKFGRLIGPLYSNPNSSEYNLGYRTDRTKCNIAKIDWTQNTSAIDSLPDVATVVGALEDGTTKGKNSFSIKIKGQTWIMKNKYAKEADRMGANGAHAYAIGLFKSAVTFEGYKGISQYWEPEKYTENTNKDIPVPHGNLGIDISIDLNEGDPYLKPPRNALLWDGTINTNADSANLPSWLFQNATWESGPAKLKINEITLHYSGGRLKSNLKCSMNREGR